MKAHNSETRNYESYLPIVNWRSSHFVGIGQASYIAGNESSRRRAVSEAYEMAFQDFTNSISLLAKKIITPKWTDKNPIAFRNNQVHIDMGSLEVWTARVALATIAIRFVNRMIF